MDRNAAAAKITAAQASNRAPGDHFLTGHLHPPSGADVARRARHRGRGNRRYANRTRAAMTWITPRPISWLEPWNRSVGARAPGRSRLERQGAPPEVLERLPPHDGSHGLPDPLDELLGVLDGGEAELHGD